MEKKLNYFGRKLFIYGFFLMMLFCNRLHAQTGSGIAISWNSEVGCQTYSQEDGPKEREFIFLEDITDGQCPRICENSTVVYTLMGTLGANPNTQWTVSGGTISNTTTSSCTIQWGVSGPGAITFTVNTPSGIITKTLCIEIIKTPIALFNVVPHGIGEGAINACANQTLFFSNLSSNNGGSELVSYHWDFGDNSFSTAFEPSHVYLNSQAYGVTLTVTNACNCKSVYYNEINVEKSGFDIICPSVVCEGQTDTYSLPFEGKELCDGNFNWTVQGGDSTIEDNGDVTVNWNQVDATGFGYVTFDPSLCNIECPNPTTIKIPVIQAKGTIQGDAVLCYKEYGRYTLPQWPTTNFTWEIVGNAGGDLAEVIPTDQRNEVIIRPLQTGTLILRATYQNTLLHCGGTAIFEIKVNKQVDFQGDTVICRTNSANYFTTDAINVNWTLTNAQGVVVNTLTNSSEYHPVLANLGNYVVTVSGDDVCNGQSMSLSVVKSPTAPLASDIIGDAVVCPNAPYTYSILNPDPNSQYIWAIGNGTFMGSSTGTEVTVKFSTNLTNQISVSRKLLTPSKCSSPFVSKAITLKQIDVEISAGNNTVCGSNFANYQVNTAGTSTLYNEGESYVWSIANPSLGSIASGQGTNQVSVLWNNVLASTTTDLKLEIRKCSIIKSVIQSITILPVPSISINSVNTICSGGSITFSINSNITLATGTVVAWDFGYGTTINGGTSITTDTYNNMTTGNIGYVVTATISQPNGCFATVSATKNLTITPGPNASLSITSGGNVFCNANDIVTVLTAATTSGATISWFKSPAVNLGQSGPSLYVNGFGFGEYYFKATYNGCTTKSNSINIIQSCGSPPACTVNPTPNVAVTSTTNDCGDLTLIGSASPTNLVSEHWGIIGPDVNDDFSGNPVYYNAATAGEYNTFFKADYLNGSGQTCTFTSFQKVIVPYLPNFSYNVTCNNNTSFNIVLTDNSDFFTPVVNRTFKYYISTDGVSFTLINGVNAPGFSAQNFTITNQAPGNYFIKLVISGTIAGTSYPVCEKIIPISLATIVTPNITFNTPACNDTPVQFTVTNHQDGNTYFWTFEPGATNLQQNPVRVFANTDTYTNVTLVVTNKYGCSNTYNVPSFYVPQKCFNGDIISIPGDATVCKNSSVILKYFSAIPGECAIANYILMNGTAQVATSTFNSFQVSTPGFYWMKVQNSSGCTYECRTRISPSFKTPPSVKIMGPAAICEGSQAIATATTNGTTFGWILDGIPQTAFANNPEFVLSSLAVGVHNLVLSATLGGCSAETTNIITVASLPTAPVISIDNVDCSTYEVSLSASGPGPGTYTWSNGMSGSAITVYEGGPYQVRFTNASGCSATTQIDVPKNPDSYMWIFPSGCFAACQDSLGTLIGPNLLLPAWAWLFNESEQLADHDSFTSPLSLGNSGTYNLMLHTGLCEKVSLPLELTLIPECAKCPFSEIEIKDIEVQNENFCSYTVSITIYNSSGTDIPVTLTVPNDQAIVSPSGFVMGSGGGTYTFTIIPINGYAGGELSLLLSGTTDERPCILPFTLDLPFCESGTGKINTSKTVAVSLMIYPNPAQNQVAITYQAQQTNTQLEVYDLMGRWIASYNAKELTGTWQLDINTIAAGIYVVVMKQNDLIVLQKKLQVL